MEEKQKRKEARKKVDAILLEKSPSPEVIETEKEQPISSKGEEKVSSARKVGNSLIDFFAKVPDATLAP
jgi:hypothetical protein